MHAFVCKHAFGWTHRHHALNDVIAKSSASAAIPVFKEPTGIYRDSVKRPDGVTLVPWQSGRALIWDVTVATTLADSYLPASSVTAAAAAEAAASRKEVKYSDLPFLFQPIAVQTLGPINESAVDFLRELGCNLLQVPRGATVYIPVPEAISHCAAIQCRHFA